MRYHLLLLTIALTSLAARAEKQVKQYDVVVVGGTASGVGAAFAAAREGLKVALTEESPGLGGMFSNGVCNTNIRALGGSNGIFEEFRLRVLKYHQQTLPQDPIVNLKAPRESRLFPLNRSPGSLGLVFEPRVADMIFKQMAAEIRGLDIFYRHYPVRVLKKGNRVTGVVARNAKDGSEIEFRATVTMDATHEGDLLPMAGTRFRLGREARSPEEPHAGKMYMTWDGHFFGTGEGDNKLQAFQLFMVLKDYGSGSDKRIPQPPGYNKTRYIPTNRVTPNIPNGKMLFSGTDETGINSTFIDGDRRERQRVYDAYKNFSLGYLYYLQTEMGLKQIGLAEDEFTDNGNLPYMLYVREGRRLEGMHIFNERDCTKVTGFIRPPLQKDTIAVGDWESDSHQMDKDFEGYVHWAPGSRDPYNMTTPYQIPYGVLVPKDVNGFLVPMAVSSTHIGYGVLRTDPPRLNMGQAAGLAAAMAIRGKTEVRNISVPELQRRLLEQGQTLFYYTDLYPSHRYFKEIQRISMAGITEGFDDFSFRPDDPATVADISQIVFHGLGLKVKVDDWSTDFYKMRHWHPAAESNRPSHWSSYFLMTLYKMGAIGEQQASKLRVTDHGTRGQLAHWLAVSLGLKASGTGFFSDVPASHAYAGSIQALAEKGLLPGDKGSRFEPDRVPTRGEVCHLVDFVRSKR